MVRRHQQPAELRVVLHLGAQGRHRLGRLRHVAHEVVDLETAVAVVDHAHARRREADDVLRHHALEMEGGEGGALDDVENFRSPHVALLRHDETDDGIAAAELLADLAVDLDQRMVFRQAGLDVEIRAQPDRVHVGEEEVPVPAQHVLDVEAGDGDHRVHLEAVHQGVEAGCVEGRGHRRPPFGGLRPT